MGRPVRFAAGSLVLAGLLTGRRRPAARRLSAGVAGGLVCSAPTATCGRAKLLAKIPPTGPGAPTSTPPRRQRRQPQGVRPHNQPGSTGLDVTLAALTG
ncbi:hypothetical protein [Streptomyces albus]|uniref:hypothetical protein n=1 Tax=Streptomyces albus TaxID=1888 RepID=UPI003D0A9FC6